MGWFPRGLDLRMRGIGGRARAALDLLFAKRPLQFIRRSHRAQHCQRAAGRPWSFCRRHRAAGGYLPESLPVGICVLACLPFAFTSKELVKLPVEAFVEFLDDIVDDDTKKQVKTTLVEDKQLPDKSRCNGQHRKHCKAGKLQRSQSQYDHLAGLPCTRPCEGGN